ncbi:hypothetical protein SCHPADRAFT_993774 [Schizopora paradoxa]|uniref:Uncharacterized protein n=1 Tax=Schizopora paradoxa TaxID=27342 RepID=A0A0H2SM56_9AGAM|nr:hypothetical protein SCHPADRAFT_993774 [Schizopora paradoxa]
MSNILKSERWRCHHPNEDYCAQNTELLLKHLDAFFTDTTPDIEGLEGITFDESHGIDAHRHAVDKCDVLIRINRMQIEVMRRAMKRKQEDLNALVAERSRLISLIDRKITFIDKPLPTLPNETIAQILSYLYSVEERDPDVWPTDDPEETTLQRLVLDSSLSSGWRNFIRRQVPVVIKCHCSRAEYADRRTGNVHLVGDYPRVLSVEELQGEEDLDNVMGGLSTTIFADLSEEKDMEELEEIRGYPWRNLVLASDERGSSKEVTGKFVRRFGRELAYLHRLEIQPRHLTDQSAPLWNSSEADDFIRQGNLAPKLRVVRAPSGLLPCLRPILNNVAILDIAINFGDPYNAAARDSVNALLEGLANYSDTLTVLKLAPVRDHSMRCLTDVRIRARSPSLGPGDDPSSIKSKHPRLCRVAFPNLKQLKLRLSAPTTHDILSAVDCTSLSHLDITVSETWVDNSRRRGRPKETTQEISTSFLHSIFPKLMSLAIRLDSTSLLRSYESLEAPDKSGEWLLPKLVSLELYIYNWTEDALLESAERVIINRLKTAATESIRSIRVTVEAGVSAGGPGQLYNLFSKHFDTFRFFVPDVIISDSDDQSSDTW